MWLFQTLFLYHLWAELGSASHICPRYLRRRSFAVLQDDNIGCLVAGAAWHKQIWKLRSCSAQSALALSALLSSSGHIIVFTQQHQICCTAVENHSYFFGDFCNIFPNAFEVPLFLLSVFAYYHFCKTIIIFVKLHNLLRVQTKITSNTPNQSIWGGSHFILLQWQNIYH